MVLSICFSEYEMKKTICDPYLGLFLSPSKDVAESVLRKSADSKISKDSQASLQVYGCAGVLPHQNQTPAIGLTNRLGR